MKIGIFGGSFDPVHEGHVKLARYARDHAGLDEVWLMVSPRNPLKPKGPDASDNQRLEMAALATKDMEGIKVSDFEFGLPIPSYSYHTLEKLKEKYPQHDFRLIIGEDNWESFDRWKNPDEIIERFSPIVYPRANNSSYGNQRSSVHDSEKTYHPAADGKVTFLPDAPLMDVSSTEIRDRLKNGISVEELIATSVEEYIRKHGLYGSV